MKRWPRTRRSTLATLALVAVTFLTGCGGDAESKYAGSWNRTCRDLSTSYREFRLAAATSIDEYLGDPENSLASDNELAATLKGPLKDLRKGISMAVAEISEADPPKAWAGWHQQSLSGLRNQQKLVGTSSKALQAGDKSAIAGLTMGSFGPANVDAPSELRNQTPSCTALS